MEISDYIKQIFLEAKDYTNKLKTKPRLEKITKLLLFLTYKKHKEM